MPRGSIIAAIAVTALLTGCHGLDNLTAPPSSNTLVTPPTIVPETRLSPSGNETSNQEDNHQDDIPDVEDDTACEDS